MSKANTIASELCPSVLCCRYFLIFVVDAWLTAVDGGCVRDRVVRWGIGVLQDGEQEFLGVWPGTDSLETVWPTIANDLKVRGVERIRFVAGSDPASIQAAMRGSYPGVTVLPAVLEQLEPNFACPPRQRRILHNAVDAANQWSRHLNRAVARHGCFSSPAAATSFVVDRLTRAERDLCALGVDVFPGPAHPVARTIRRPGIAAPGV